MFITKNVLYIYIALHKFIIFFLNLIINIRKEKLLKGIFFNKKIVIYFREI